MPVLLTSHGGGDEEQKWLKKAGYRGANKNKVEKQWAKGRGAAQET